MEFNLCKVLKSDKIEGTQSALRKYVFYKKIENYVTYLYDTNELCNN